MSKTVTVQIDVDLLRKQRDYLVSLVFAKVILPEREEYIDGLINMCDRMLDQAEL